MPNVSTEKQIEADETVARFIRVTYRIYLKRKAEGRLPSQDDKSK